ncbi:hypothetical protein C8R43DRAFT_1243196 [Mycena crocata]|nr:hypothetical protein C8R43DRAFT_1243196 [Mycena crocata]
MTNTDFAQSVLEEYGNWEPPHTNTLVEYVSLAECAFSSGCKQRLQDPAATRCSARQLLPISVAPGVPILLCLPVVARLDHAVCVVIIYTPPALPLINIASCSYSPLASLHPPPPSSRLRRFDLACLSRPILSIRSVHTRPLETLGSLTIHGPQSVSQMFHLAIPCSASTYLPHPPVPSPALTSANHAPFLRNPCFAHTPSGCGSDTGTSLRFERLYYMCSTPCGHPSRLSRTVPQTIHSLPYRIPYAPPSPPFARVSLALPHFAHPPCSHLCASGSFGSDVLPHVLVPGLDVSGSDTPHTPRTFALDSMCLYRASAASWFFRALALELMYAILTRPSLESPYSLDPLISGRDLIDQYKALSVSIHKFAMFAVLVGPYAVRIDLRAFRCLILNCILKLNPSQSLTLILRDSRLESALQAVSSLFRAFS